MSCVEAVSYSNLLCSCVRMLLSTCTYLLTHTVTGESKRERIISEKREAQAQGVRERQTSRERESSSLSGRSEPNRTVVEAEREVEIREEKDRVVQEEVAVVSNGLTIIDDQKGHSNSVQEEVAVVSNGLIIVDDQTVHSYSHTKVRYSSLSLRRLSTLQCCKVALG